MNFNNYLKESLCTILVIWFFWSFMLIFLPSAVVLQFGEHRHIVVLYTENNNTKLHKELTAIADKYIKD